jgi:hypothetical protein
MYNNNDPFNVLVHTQLKHNKQLSAVPKINMHLKAIPSFRQLNKEWEKRRRCDSRAHFLCAIAHKNRRLGAQQSARFLQLKATTLLGHKTLYILY